MRLKLFVFALMGCFLFPQAAQAEADAIKQAIARRAELKKQLSADTTLAKKTGTFIPKIDGAIAKA